MRLIRRCDDLLRPHQQGLNRNGVIGRLRDEGGIRAVFQQAADEIGEQIAVTADRRIGAQRQRGPVRMKLRIERVAHAVQTLKLVVAGLARKFRDGRHRQRVMGGELREDARAQGEQLARAGDIVEIGHRLAGENRIAVEAALLRAFDFGVPVRALHQAERDAPVVPLGKSVDMVDHRLGPFLIGLHGEAESIPPGERRIGEHRIDHIERQFEPVRFLGVDGEMHVTGFCALREIAHQRHNLRHHARPAQRLIARMQRGELDGDSRLVRRRAFARGRADGVDGRGISLEVVRGGGGGARAFAQHVEGITMMMRRPVVVRGARQRGVNGLAQHEMIAHQAHGLPGRGAHGRQADALCDGADGALRRFAGPDHPRGEAERPDGGIDQQRLRSRLMMREVALAEFVFDEAVRGGGIRHAQQRLRHHHQREAFLGGEREFAQHVLDAAEAAVLRANRVDQACRGAVDAGLLFRR